MIIEPLEPLKIRLAGEVRTLEPGRPVDLPDAKARKLLALANGKVRLVIDQCPRVGEIVQWNSPLFGRLQGAVLGVFPHAVKVGHPFAHEGAATIPKAWLIETEEA